MKEKCRYVAVGDALQTAGSAAAPTVIPPTKSGGGGHRCLTSDKMYASDDAPMRREDEPVIETKKSDQEAVLSYYSAIAQTRAADPLQIDGDYWELLDTNEELFAYERTYADRRTVLLANFVERKIDYDSSCVENLEILIDTHEGHVRGKLQPFEAVVFATRA